MFTAFCCPLLYLKTVNMNNQNEIWRDVEGYEGIYQASNLGRVKSLDRFDKGKGGSVRVRKGRQLKLALNGGRYFLIQLHKDGARIYTSTHRVIAKAFVPNPDNKPQVNHLNGIKTDNRAENLEWCTAKENTEHAVLTGLRSENKGESNPSSKLKKEDVLFIRKVYRRGLGLILAKKFGLKQGSINQIVTRKTWKHI